MVLQERLYTVDDLQKVANLPENQDKRFELIRGVIIEMPAPSPIYAFISNKFGRYLDEYVEEHDLGYVFGDSCSYVLSESNELVPDASFISKERQPELPLPNQFRLAPDLAVEITSSETSASILQIKVLLYLDTGSKEVWVAYPKAKELQRYRADQPRIVERYRDRDTLSPESLFPGLEISLSDLFTLPDLAA